MKCDKKTTKPPQILIDFLKILSPAHSAVNLQQNGSKIPPNLKYVATLPCEILISENYRAL